MAIEWVETSHVDLTLVERAFLASSVEQATSSRRALVEQARAQAAQNRRLRGAIVGIGCLLVAALVAGFVAVDRGRTAATESTAAHRAEETSLHESLTNRSLALRNTNRGLAALLAVEAYRQRPDALARSALLGTFTWSPGFLGYRWLAVKNGKIAITKDRQRRKSAGARRRADPRLRRLGALLLHRLPQPTARLL